MKILFVSPSVPSPLHRIRALHLLKAFSKSHTVRLVTLAPRSDSAQSVEHLSFLETPPRVIPHAFAASVRFCLSAPFLRRPLELAYCASDAMRAAVAEELKAFRPDLLYVKRLRSAQFVPAQTSCPAILDVTDAMAESYRRAAPFSPLRLRPVFWHEARTYARAERDAANIFRQWVVASASDAALLRKTLPPETALHIVPNVVDTETFFPRPGAEEAHHLLFSGLMDKVVNVSAAVFFVREILPRIRARIPTVTLTIAGPRATSTVRALAREPGVSVTGYVEDLRILIARAAAVIAPLRSGTGTRNKILQAWAMGKAVISTPEGAEGLRASHGENILIAASPARFADAVILTLKDMDLRARLGAGGRETVERQYSIAVLAAALESVLASLREPAPHSFP